MSTCNEIEFNYPYVDYRFYTNNVSNKDWLVSFFLDAEAGQITDLIIFSAERPNGAFKEIEATQRPKDIVTLRAKSFRNWLIENALKSKR